MPKYKNRPVMLFAGENVARKVVPLDGKRFTIEEIYDGLKCEDVEFYDLDYALEDHTMIINAEHDLKRDVNRQARDALFDYADFWRPIRGTVMIVPNSYL